MNKHLLQIVCCVSLLISIVYSCQWPVTTASRKWNTCMQYT